MTEILIPIRDLLPPALAAVRFAIEFGKRSKAKLYFLFVDDPGVGSLHSGKISGQQARDAELIHEAIQALINCGRDHDGLHTETYHHKGDYIQEIGQFVREHNIDEIVVSLPDETEALYEQTKKEIQLLLHMTHCRVLTVKPQSKGI